MKKNLIIFAIFVIGVFLCAGTVSAASTHDGGSMVTTQKKVIDTTFHKTVNTLLVTHKVYFKKNGKICWYTYSTHYINYHNVYTNYATSWGSKGYLKFYKSNSRWYMKSWNTAGPQFWATKNTITKLPTSYNTYTSSKWLKYLDNYSKYDVKQWLS